MALFSHLTAYLNQFGPKGETDWIGEYHGFPVYSPVVEQFRQAVGDLVQAYPEVADYPRLLKDKNIQDFERLEQTGLSLMELVTVLVGLVRLERFNEGLIWRSLTDGHLQMLLERIKAYDC